MIAARQYRILWRRCQGLRGSSVSAWARFYGLTRSSEGQGHSNVSSEHDEAAGLAGPAPPILRRAVQWLQHSALRQEVEAALQALASSSEAPVQYSWLPVPDRDTSVALLRPERGPSFCLIITEVSRILQAS